MTSPTVVVAGVGTSQFGRAPDQRIEQLAWDAATEALTDAGLDPSDIDAVFLGTVFAPSGAASRITRGLGLANVPTYRLEAACASGSVAFHEGVHAVRSGRYRQVLVLGVEHLSSVFDGPIMPEASDAEGRSGLALPALYALQAQRYLHDHGEDAALLADVAHKNKQHGRLNPRAHLRAAPSVEEILASRLIADPLTLQQCCPMTDGAAAAVLRPATGAAHEVRVVASEYEPGRAWGRGSSSLWGADPVRRAMSRIEQAHHLGARDMDLLEVHDAFTIGEVVTLEALGLCEPGHGIHLAGDGVTRRDGRWPVNPSGGLLSRGHPLGATGVAQVAEVCWQLTGRAGDRQIADAELGLVETMGGGASGLDGNAAVVAVLSAG